MPNNGTTQPIGANLKASKRAGYKTVRVNDLSRSIIERARAVRDLRGLGQSEVEENAGLSRGALSRIESGSRGRSLSIETIVALAGGLKVGLMWLITGHGRVPYGLENETDLPPPYDLEPPSNTRRKDPSQPR